MDDDSLGGRFVVATPSLRDPNFEHAVVLLLEHGDGGALGLVLNRPSDVGVGEVLSGRPSDPVEAERLAAWEPLVSAPTVVFVGGPVQAGQAMIGLGRTAAASGVVDGVDILDLGAGPIGGSWSEVRLYTGYAGWGPGQLESELDAGGWFLVDGGDEDVFAADPAELWRGVLRRQGGIFRTIPDEPGLN